MEYNIEKEKTFFESFTKKIENELWRIMVTRTILMMNKYERARSYLKQCRKKLPWYKRILPSSQRILIRVPAGTLVTYMDKDNKEKPMSIEMLNRETKIPLFHIPIGLELEKNMDDIKKKIKFNFIEFSKYYSKELSEFYQSEKELVRLKDTGLAIKRYLSSVIDDAAEKTKIVNEQFMKSMIESLEKSNPIIPNLIEVMEDLLKLDRSTTDYWNTVGKISGSIGFGETSKMDEDDLSVKYNDNYSIIMTSPTNRFFMIPNHIEELKDVTDHVPMFIDQMLKDGKIAWVAANIHTGSYQILRNFDEKKEEEK